MRGLGRGSVVNVSNKYFLFEWAVINEHSFQKRVLFCRVMVPLTYRVCINLRHNKRRVRLTLLKMAFLRYKTVIGNNGERMTQLDTEVS